MRDARTTALTAALLFAAFPVHADPAARPVATPYVEDCCGIIVEVTLSARRADVPDRAFRFLLDTGAVINVIDLSVPAAYFWDEPDAPQFTSRTVKDGSGVDLPAQYVALKSLSVGGISKSPIAAVRMDLHASVLGRAEDEPIDGILGMNFLHQTRLVIDPTRHQIDWGAAVAGHVVPLSYGEGLVPVLPVVIDGQTVPFLMDTGADGGFSGPGEADEADVSDVVYGGGLSGVMLEGKRTTVPKAEVNGAPWINAPGTVFDVPGTPISVGRCVLLAGPLGLDFVHHRAIFQRDASGNLPTRECRDPDISVEWLWVGDNRELSVGRLGAKSRMAALGFMTGDRVQRVGALEGRALSVRSIRELSRAADPVEWVVLRQNEPLHLIWSAPPR